MRANPGGHLDPADVIGRDALIGDLWRILERQSVVLYAERRTGKTCIIKKMQAEAPDDRLVSYQELERVHSLLEFVEAVFHDVERHLSRWKRTAEGATRLLRNIGGTEIGGVLKFPEPAAAHWKDLLVTTIEDLMEHQERRVILLWDEVPLMLDNIARRGGRQAAMELLDTLRSLRQMHPALRMVFTGSIGLHHVIVDLRKAGYANDPTNDMLKVNVPALDPEAGQELARRLLGGEGIPTDDVDATARGIAEAVDHVPYFIHHVVDQMARRGGPADAALAEAIVRRCLVDPQDTWDLHHYRARIDTYYTPEERPVALGILDAIAGSDDRLPFDEVFNRLKARLATEDIELARHVLMLVRRDHYLDQAEDGSYGFAFSLVKRWWRLDRGLSS